MALTEQGQGIWCCLTLREPSAATAPLMWGEPHAEGLSSPKLGHGCGFKTIRAGSSSVKPQSLA